MHYVGPSNMSEDCDSSYLVQAGIEVEAEIHLRIYLELSQN